MMPTKRYKETVEKYGDEAIAMLDDTVVRHKETEVLLSFFNVYETYNRPLSEKNIGDIGCGDGYSLEKISERFQCNFFGIDLTEELIGIARKRNIKNCMFWTGNATALPIAKDFFDIVYTQRCLINLPSWEDQKKALHEIYRVLKPGGKYLMIEGFTDGLINNNKARMECGLPELKEAEFNKYIDKELFLPEVEGKFKVNRDSSYNFLSSHYFISRVLHALVTKGEQVKNTEFVKFFSYLPPIGNYSPIQTFVLEKKVGP